MRRPGLARWVAPAAFLAGLTIAVLLIRSGLEGGSSTPGTQPATTQASTSSKPAAKPRRPRTKTGSAASTATGAAQYYVVQTGDTFGSIASRYGTSVQELEALNPGVSSTSLSVGQRLRVK